MKLYVPPKANDGEHALVRDNGQVRVYSSLGAITSADTVPDKWVECRANDDVEAGPEED